MSLVCWITLFVLLGLSEANLPPMPPQEEWVLNFDSPVYVCPDEISQAFVDTSAVEVQRHNETVAFMTGTYKFLHEIEPCTLVELIVEKDKNGRKEVMATLDICDLCEETAEDSNYYKYLKYFGVPTTCPFGVGEYSIDQFVPDSDDLPVNQANEGRYCVTINFYGNSACDCKDDRTFYGCLKLDFVIEPL